MNALDNYGAILLQQHEGNRQIASALARSAHVSVQRLAKLLSAVRCRVSGRTPRD